MRVTFYCAVHWILLRINKPMSNLTVCSILVLLKLSGIILFFPSGLRLNGTEGFKHSANLMGTEEHHETWLFRVKKKNPKQTNEVLLTQSSSPVQPDGNKFNSWNIQVLINLFTQFKIHKYSGNTNEEENKIKPSPSGRFPSFHQIQHSVVIGWWWNQSKGGETGKKKKKRKERGKPRISRSQSMLSLTGATCVNISEEKKRSNFYHPSKHYSLPHTLHAYTQRQTRGYGGGEVPRDQLHVLYTWRQNESSLSTTHTHTHAHPDYRETPKHSTTVKSLPLSFLQLRAPPKIQPIKEKPFA